MLISNSTLNTTDLSLEQIFVLLDISLVTFALVLGIIIYLINLIRRWIK